RLLNRWHTRLPTDHDDLIDVVRPQSSVGKRLFDWCNGSVDQVAGQLLELGAAEVDVEMARAAGVGGDERQVDLSLEHGRKLHLGLLASLFQPLQRGSISAQIDPGLALELSRQ